MPRRLKAADQHVDALAARLAKKLDHESLLLEIAAASMWARHRAFC
jgi:hypothetical protein